MSLQSRSRKLAEKSRSNQKKRTELEQSLKLEKLKALDKTSGKGKNRESGIKRTARKNQIKALDKKVTKPTTKKITPKVTPKVTPKPKRATDKGGRSAVPGTMRGKQVNTKMGPNMSKVTKVTAADRKKQKGGADNRSTMQKLFGASEEKRKMGRNMQKRAQASMGFKKGGKVRGDGVCRKGKTKGRMV